MRIIGGKYRGRLFRPGKNFNARPTTDLAKESLFNILQNRLYYEELNALDLFSGTGSISFELASRGCRQILAIENNFQHYKFIRQTIEQLKEEHIKVQKADVFRFLGKCTNQYDFIFADPPYDHKLFAQVPELVLSRHMIAPEGLFILEHSADYDFSTYAEFFELRRYGSVHFSFFKNS